MPRLLVVVAALVLCACHDPAPVVASHAPEEPVASEALGVAMPPGTRRVAEDGGAGPEGASTSMVALATESSTTDALAYFAALTGAVTTRPACVSVDGAEVCITSPGDIPRTLFAPVRPVVDAAPSGARAWIRVTRTGSPAPCPPCQPGGYPPPGCSCP